MIHEEKIREWVIESKDKTIQQIVKLYAAIDSLIALFISNNIKSFEMETEEEEES